MLIIPAIDLKDGRCVRLRQGRMEDDTVFADDPTIVARRWIEQGARRLHLVDLDGAFAGEPKNAAVVRAIVAGAGDVPVQIGGGIRTPEIADAYVEAGVRWLIVGTLAVREPAFVDALCARHPGRVIVGLDAKDGRVATDGWAETSDVRASELAKRFEGLGVAAIVYTDIARDGMMQGVNVAATAEMADAVEIPVIASGGVTNLDDIRALVDVTARRQSGKPGADTLEASAANGSEAGTPGGEGASAEDGPNAITASGGRSSDDAANGGRPIAGAIIGRALYEGTIELAAAQALADSLIGGAEASG